MTTSLHYKSNLRDTLFNLFEFLDIGRTALGKPPFEGLDEATARELLAASERVCATEMAHTAGFSPGAWLSGMSRESRIGWLDRIRTLPSVKRPRSSCGISCVRVRICVSI